MRSRPILPNCATAANAAQQTSSLDLMRDIKRLNDHLVAGAAYPVLEASGDLMPSPSPKTAATADPTDRGYHRSQGTVLLAAATRFANAATSFLSSDSLISA